MFDEIVERTTAERFCSHLEHHCFKALSIHSTLLLKEIQHHTIMEAHPSDVYCKRIRLVNDTEGPPICRQRTCSPVVTLPSFVQP